MSSFNETTVKITDDERVLEKLRRLKKTEKDEHGEFLWAMVSGESFKMYLKQPRELPQDFAAALVSTEWVPLDEPCKLCVDKKGEPTGYAFGNVCHKCKGNKYISLNATVPVYVETGTRSTKAFDVKALPPPVAVNA